MKTILKIGCGVLFGLAVVAIVGIMLIGQCLPPPPETATPTPELPSPPTQEKPEDKLIRDLTYVTIVGYGYTDDADPEYEGVQIGFLWYDSKSEQIYFRNIPMLVTIELFTTKFNPKTMKSEPDRSVYKGQAQIDSSLSHIRIPFEHIKVNPSIDHQFGMGKVTVHTPQQGELSDKMELVPLYEKPKE